MDKTINMWTIEYNLYMADYLIGNIPVGKDPSSFERSDEYLINFEKLGNDKNNIKVIKNFLSDEECDLIVSKVDGKDASMVKSHSYDKRKIFNHDLYPNILLLGSIVRNKIEELYSIKVKQTSIPNITQWSESNKMSAHVDDLGNEEYHIASIIYLNDNYAGGEISFITHDLSIKPDRGDLLIFPGNLHYCHEVQKVLEGSRFTIPIWYSFA